MSTAIKVLVVGLGVFMLGALAGRDQVLAPGQAPALIPGLLMLVGAVMVFAGVVSAVRDRLRRS